jgi:hypothetical protein
MKNIWGAARSAAVIATLFASSAKAADPRIDGHSSMAAVTPIADPQAPANGGDMDNDYGNWFSVAVKITDAIGKGKPFDAAQAPELIRKLKEEVAWENQVFGAQTAPAPGQGQKVFTSQEQSSKVAAVLVIDPDKNTVAAFRVPVYGDTNVLNVVKAEPDGLYDNGNVAPTRIRQQEIYAEAIGLLIQRNAQFVPPAGARPLPKLAI